MTDLFDKLYSQFLSGKTNRKDFEGFKESLNHLSDQELAEGWKRFGMRIRFIRLWKSVVSGKFIGDFVCRYILLKSPYAGPVSWWRRP